MQFSLLQDMLLNRPNGSEVLEVATGVPAAGARAGDEPGSVSFLVERSQDQRNLMGRSL